MTGGIGKRRARFALVGVLAIATLAAAGCASGRHRAPHADPAASRAPAAQSSAAEPANGDAAPMPRPATAPAPLSTGWSRAETPAADAPPRDPVLASFTGRNIHASEAALWFFKVHRDKAIAALQKLIGAEIVGREAARVGLEWPAEEVERARQAILGAVQQEAAVQFGLGTTPERFVALRFGESLEAHLERRVEEERQRWLFSRIIRWHFSRQDRVELAVIVVKDPALGRELEAKIRDGADFVALARKHSAHATAKEGGLLPPLPREALVPAVAEAAFALAEGSVTPLVEIEDGTGQRQWELAKVLKRHPARHEDFAALREEIERGLRERPVDVLEWSAWMLGLERLYNVRVADDL
jgi:hypothetical protein